MQFCQANDLLNILLNHRNVKIHCYSRSHLLEKQLTNTRATIISSLQVGKYVLNVVLSGTMITVPLSNSTYLRKGSQRQWDS